MQMQFESQQATHDARLAEANAERDRLATHLATALDSCRKLEADLQQSRCAFSYVFAQDCFKVMLYLAPQLMHPSM